MYHLMIVGNANFCISDNPVFFNHMIQLETSGIYVFPAEISRVHYFLLTDKMTMAWADEKNIGGVTGHGSFRNL
ncbi:hypothetical protein [Desulfotignum balticum]|uniref:hypothetical protein n=1 Tax=Desulfotignum balticum TaxID=115781 RepID=UPI0004140BD9|nr:hypothetical protein [Desulfotignum balticum]